ncbi:unnamed protein product [Rotaria sp. Silwood1]|nr:unnamed protein product [Rotaria sp. Silwood1]CAF4653709.1 unnamed protein product [Rotaria sp. Silwood1]CAF4744537.1 unnamed protein product [Rotaria sp. Silwood1]
MKPKTTSSNNFDRPKLLLFKFLAHQIHPFAYAVNTFLQPALDDCQALLHDNPQDTFNILLSLTQTFIRFAPDTELIYDDIQQFASKLKNSIDECFIWLDPDTIQHSSQLLESIRHNLLFIIKYENKENNIYTNMYKNMSKLTNLQKINSLPTEIQIISANNNLDTTVPIEKMNKKHTEIKINEHSDLHESNEYDSTTMKQIITNSIPFPSVMSTSQNEKCSTFILPLQTNQSESSSLISYPSTQNNIVSSMATSVTTKLMNQMKNLSVNSVPISTTTNQSSSKTISNVSYLSEYEITDPTILSKKKSIGTIASYPPRNISITTTDVNNQNFSSKLNIINKDEKIRSYECNTPSSILLNDDLLRSGTTSNTYSIFDDEWDNEATRQYYLNQISIDPTVAGANWHPVKECLSIVMEQSHINYTTGNSHSHITDRYIREFENKQNRPILYGDLCMTYGTPQNSPHATCLPIGVALSYDELTLLSCDVHRNSQNVRLFDIETGRLKHTIASNQQMKFHRPSAVMSNVRNNILIVERDYIFITEPDGRLIQTIGHRSIKQLYGIAVFHDRYLLTIDSKSIDNQTPENSRLLLFDPNNGQLVFEQSININRESEDILKQQSINHIQGKILSETTSKPRFLTAYNDNIYIADLGRSLIYGTTLRNGCEYQYTTIFGGQGRANGEMTDPSGLFIDTGGNIISADSKNDRIQIFTSDGEYKTTLKLNERIKRPSGICTNRLGTKFYISCYLAGCIRAFNITY